MEDLYFLHDKFLKEHNRRQYLLEHKFLMIAIHLMLERNSTDKVIEKLNEAIAWLEKNKKNLQCCELEL